MVDTHVRLFDSLRGKILTRLLEVRGGIDHAYAKIPGEVMRAHFEILLDKVRTYLAIDDASSYRRFAIRYLAIRVAEGFSHENLIHSVVAIGDVAAQVARTELEPSVQREEFLRALTRMNFAHARMLVAFVADDLAERLAHRELVLRSVR
ncbi:MAG: hypothetical protein AAGC55_14455 [Myxococcota bacterium]